MLALVLTSWQLGPVVADQEVGRIDGQLVNGTAGSPPAAGVQITVHVLQDRAKVEERTVLSDERGAFSIDGLPTGPGYVYLPIADYGAVGYFPERPVTMAEAAEKRVEIRIFEPTDADSAIQVDRANLLLVRVAPGSLTVMEMGAVVNGSDRSYVGDVTADPPRPTLRFDLPLGADQLTPQAGLVAGELVPTSDGFLSVDPVLPGRHELAFSYQIPVESTTLDLTKRLEYSTATFNLYVPDTGITVVSPGLAFQGTSEFGGQRFQLYSAQSLPRGTEIKARLAGLPAPPGLDPRQLGFVVVGTSGALLSAAGLLAVRRRWRAAEAQAGLLKEARRERSELVWTLAELDECFSAGKLDEQRYREQRAQGKERLLRLSGTKDDGR